MQSDPPTKESLAQLLTEFIQYQEKRLGKNAADRHTTRLPMRCFMDFKSGGALCQIFSIMFRYKADQRLRKLDFNVTKAQSRKDKDPNVQLLAEIETGLIDEQFLRLPVVFIRPEVDNELREKITQIITNRQGEVVKEEEEATHIIYPPEDPTDDYGRPLFRRGKNVMIHWYYFPESYDSWTPSTFELPVSSNNHLENCR